MAKCKVIAVVVGIIGGFVFPPLFVLPAFVLLPSLRNLKRKVKNAAEQYKNYKEERAIEQEVERKMEAGEELFSEDDFNAVNMHLSSFHEQDEDE